MLIQDSLKNSSFLNNVIKNPNAEENQKTKFTLDFGDSAEISNTAKSFRKIDSFLNLGKPRSFSLEELSPEEKEEFLSMLSSLLKKGIIGYEELEVDGKREKHFIVTQIGNERLKGARLYNDKLKNYTRYEDVITPDPLNLSSSK